MASKNIQKRPNGRYRARYRDAAGKEHARHFERKGDASRWLDEMTADVLTGRYVDPKRAKTALAKVAAEYLANPTWKATTKARNESIVAKHILPRFGDLPLSSVDVSAIQAWVNEQVKAGAAPGTVRKNASVLSSILEHAVKTRSLAVNPVPEVDLPKAKTSRRRYLDFGEVDALAKAAGDNRLIILTLAYCGLRIGELAALRVGKVDVARRRLQIDESVTEVGGVLHWSDTKDRERRSVPIPGPLVDEIGDMVAGRPPDALAFTAERGGVLRVRNMRRAWFDDAVKAAGVGPLTPHELRHTAASLAVKVGASVLSVQRMLGHAKPSITLDTYSDLFDMDLDDVSARLADHLRPYHG